MTSGRFENNLPTRVNKTIGLSRSNHFCQGNTENCVKEKIHKRTFKPATFKHEQNNINSIETAFFESNFRARNAYVMSSKIDFKRLRLLIEIFITTSCESFRLAFVESTKKT